MGILQQVRAVMAEMTVGKQGHLPQALQDRVHVLRQEGGAAVNQELESFADYARVYECYIWVRKAIEVYADNTSVLPVRVVDADGKEIPSHPITELLSYVNDQQSPAQLWSQYAVHKLLGGEAFIELVPNGRGQPAEMWLRRPDLVSIIPDALRPLYPAVLGYKMIGAGDTEWPADVMIHDRFTNPLSQWRGLSPIAAVRTGVTIDLYSQAWSKNMLKRNARPDYALITPQGLTPTEREDYETRLDDKFGGVENAHKPIVLEDGITDIKILSFPPKDIEWLEQRKMSRDEVGAIFRVPDEVMGYGRDTYENMDAAFRWLWLLGLKPFTQARDIALTSFFRRKRPMLKPGERIATDLSETPAMQEDVGAKAEAARTFWGIGYPLNLIDDRLSLGFGKVEGGDVGYVPITVMPTYSAQERAAPGNSSNGSPGGTDDNSNEQPPQRAVPRAIHKTVAPEYGSPRHKALWKAAVARWRPYEQAMTRRLDADFEKQRVGVREALSEAFIRAVGERIELKAGDQIPLEVADFFDKEEWDAWLAALYEALFTDNVRASAQGVLADLGLDVVFDLGKPMVQQAIREMRMTFATDINGETLRMLDEMLRDLLSEATEQGWGIFRIQQELGTRTDDVFGLRRELWQRERIARTEMHKASEMGAAEGVRQSGIEVVKAWMAALDGRERATHREAHLRYQAEPIPFNALFEVGADQMSEPGQGSLPEEVINCRCAALYIPVVSDE